MKKILACLLLISFFFCFTGCERLEKNDAQESNEGTEESISMPEILPSGGVYWATYSNIPDKPDSADQLALEGPYYVGRVEIGEPSTSEIIAAVEFEKGQNSAADTNPNDHSKYWVEKIQNAEGKTTSLKLSSTAANNFYLNLYLYSVAEDTPALNVNGLMSDSGVHSPDGSVISDPYEDPELPIAGFKELKFMGSHKQGNEIKETVEKAGYPAESVQYQNGEYSFKTLKELDGRAKIEETVLRPENWKPDKGITKGNVGLYNYSDGFTGKIKFDWIFNGIAFTVEINDAKLKMIDDGMDETNYTLSGTAEINLQSFSMGDVVYKLKDKQKKSFSDEYGFKVLKTPEPAVRWDFVEEWEYISDSQYAAPNLLMISFITGTSPTDFDDVLVEGLDELDGTYNMTFMMPAMGGTATWTFEPDNG